MDPETFPGDLLDPDLGDKNQKQVSKTWLKFVYEIKIFPRKLCIKIILFFLADF